MFLYSLQTPTESIIETDQVKRKQKKENILGKNIKKQLHY